MDAYRFLVENPEGKSYLGLLGVNGKTVLIRILNK